MSLTCAELRRGARVRFIGMVYLQVPFGAEGLVTGQDGDLWKVDFTVNGKVERASLWPSEMEVLS